MCGVFGYVGEPTDLGATLVAALRSLQYRGYDSWGIGVAIGDKVLVEKQIGHVNGASVELPLAAVGFGHTRWATHGGVTTANAHPHLDCTGAIAVIHNGIVENHRELRAALVERGHAFRSETDSEVIAHLLEDEIAAGAALERALATVFGQLVGLNAVVAMDARRQELVAAKQTSPLVAGVNARGSVIASDALALHGHADRVVYLEDDHLVRLGPDGLTLYDRRQMRPVSHEFAPLPRLLGNADLGGSSHYMDKEISEQPAVLRRLATQGRNQVEALAEAVATADDVVLVGCGTAAYAALAGTLYFSRVARRRIHPVLGSEFRQVEPLLTSRTLVIALSQSGETADVIEAMTVARRRGARLAAIVNVEQSSLDRMVELRLHLGAGPERCVLATKSYTAKLAAVLMLAYSVVGRSDEGRRLIRDAATAMESLLASSWVKEVAAAATRVAQSEHLYVVGRGLSYPTALEAALKVKEVSYVHAEGLAGGELKHGVIALITPGTPCLVFAPNDETRADAISGATELKSRGGCIIGVSPYCDPVFDLHVATPDLGNADPVVHALPAQLLAYHAALRRGTDPDRPRNLAKSVTVK